MNPKKLLKSGWKYLTSSDYRFLINANLGVYSKMPDEEYLKRKFKACMGYDLDLEAPKTFNEKLQWLKLYDRRPEYTMMADKVAVREYIAEKLGKEYLIPCLGVWEDPDDIDFDALPDQFVLKCNHNSGLGMCICKDKSKLNIKKVKKELRKGLKQNYYLTGREWLYKNIDRKIVAEAFLEDPSGDLKDYKFLCFHGRVRCSFVCSQRFSENGLCVTFFDREWKQMPFTRSHPADSADIPKPENYEKMMEIAEKLSAGIPFVRVDFYEYKGQIYFGELTFYPGCGMEAFQPDSWDKKLGCWITLPEKEI